MDDSAGGQKDFDRFIVPIDKLIIETPKKKSSESSEESSDSEK